MCIEVVTELGYETADGGEQQRLLPVRSAERLETISMMVAASASDADSERLVLVAHLYMSALVDHLATWGRSMCDGPDGLLWATIQLGLLIVARRVIESARDECAASELAKDLVGLSERYGRIVRKHIAARRDECA